MARGAVNDVGSGPAVQGGPAARRRPTHSPVTDQGRRARTFTDTTASNASFSGLPSGSALAPTV